MAILKNSPSGFTWDSCPPVFTPYHRATNNKHFSAAKASHVRDSSHKSTVYLDALLLRETFFLQLCPMQMDFYSTAKDSVMFMWIYKTAAAASVSC